MDFVLNGSFEFLAKILPLPLTSAPSRAEVWTTLRRRRKKLSELPTCDNESNRYFAAAFGGELVCPDIMVAEPSCFSSTFRLNGEGDTGVAFACINFSAPFWFCVP